jgi:hypothetical protein
MITARISQKAFHLTLAMAFTIGFFAVILRGASWIVREIIHPPEKQARHGNQRAPKNH